MTGSPSWSAGSASPADAGLVAGIAAYRRHPYRRTLIDPPVLWQEGDSRMLDFGGSGPSVLFVPSLVNRAYVLDLAPGRSMMRWFAGHGVRPLLLDWGWPGTAERQFNLTDVVAGRLERAIAAVDRPVVLAGYCMGGLLGLAAALRQPARVCALVLLAAPWDFHAGQQAEALRLAAALPLLEPLLSATGTLPVDAMQALFMQQDLGGIAAKYRAFAGMDQGSEAARGFVALEDWLNDGVPLAAPVARDTLAGWYGENQPARGTWCIAGAPVDPAAWTGPCFAAIPGRDRIVRPEGALALARRIPGATVHRPRTGHIGMAAGPRAEAELWSPLLDWLHAL